MKIRFIGLLLLISLFLLSACGQKGPLYFEKSAAPAPVASTLEKNTATEKTEKTESEEKEVKPEKKD